MTAGRKWLIAIAGLLAANVLAMTILTVLARNGATQIIPAYYDRAAHFDDEMARSAASHALGWHAAVAISGTAIEVVVSDAAGDPIEGARVRITGYQRAHASDPLDVELAPAGGGRYHGALHQRRGSYDLVVRAERAAAHYTQRVVVEVR